MKKYTLLLIAACLCFTACNSNEKPEKEESSLEYVYIDFANILHIDNKCEYIFATPKGGAKPVNAYPVSQMYYIEYNYICSSCIDEKYYSELDINTTNNIKKYYNIAKNVYSDIYSYEDFVRYLEVASQAFYNDLVDKGYSMPSYPVFFDEIRHPNLIAVNNQRKLYNALLEKYPDIPNDFHSFQKIITDTNYLKVFYERLKIYDKPFLPDFKSFVVDLGLDPDNPAKLELLL